ncbi:Four and a half LIM domains protein 3 [Sarcoptes scabiei]|uniref:Four and a half LIM domains protein 3 n=1 Tax=Sarcoptes scabiei TaxID=52283 RepID=A0A834RCT8_SARSC|nr:Four and a half LIM domains protein 3 [Sarcoptes scabiei]
MLHEIQLEFSLRATKMSNEENSPSNDNYWQQLFEYQYPRYDVSIDCLQSPFESKKSMAIKIDEDHEHRQAKRKRSLRIDPKRLRLLRLLMEDRNMNAMNIANVQEQSIKQKCVGCKKTIKKNTLLICCDRFDEDADADDGADNMMFFHPECFRCSHCHYRLAFEIYCIFNKKLFCQRHYMDKIWPRCVKCDLLIVSKHFIQTSKANDNLLSSSQSQPSSSTLSSASNVQYWHMEHFNCIYCQRSLQSDRYVLIDQSLLDPQRIKPPPPPPKPTKRNKNRGEKLKKIDQTNQQPQQQQQENVYQLDGQPCCVPCYEQNYANVCDECQKPIGVDSKDLSFNERHWHEGCFICCECKKDLYEKPFGFRADQIFCAHCYDRRFAPRCCKCDEQFVAGQRKLDYRGKQWHEHCFCCRKCLKPIGTRAFRAKKDDIYCNECYDEIFSTRCIKCSEIVTSNGVVFRDEPWHIECFKCNECNCELTSIPFLTRNDRPYCRGCHANLFAHRCQKCSKPITGTSGTKMITHETRHWHIACFRCYDCEKSLEGKGFIATDPDKDNMMAILCIDCASIRVADSMKKSEMMMMMDLNKESNTNTNNNNNKNNNNNNSASNRDINIDKNSTSKANTNTSTSNNNNNNSNNNNYDKNNNEDIYEKNSQKNTSDNTNRNDVNQIYNDDDDV